MGQETRPTVQRLRATLGAVIRGKPEAIDMLLLGILAGGHILLEDVPGVGKTTLAKALARSFSIDFARVQFTPDLLPADIVGCEVLNPADGSFTFRRGPIFSNVLLADEINRASPRTQSALLEAMNESQVTVEGATYPLPEPFLVLATQNPVDFQGTYPLPEAQLDRFLLRLRLGYPAPEQELEVLFSHRTSQPLASLEPVAGREELLVMQKEVREVEVRRPVAEYLLRIVCATRSHPRLELGASTRAALAFFRAAQARAFLHGRSYASPDDLQAVAEPVLTHRLLLTPEARYAGDSASAAIADILSDLAVPV